MSNDSSHERMWVYGSEGWYVAKWIWSDSYCEHLKTLGYRVVRSVGKRVEDEQIS